MSHDLVLYNGNILTMDAQRPLAEGIAIHGGRIVAVGSSEDALAAGPSGARCIDLQGHTALPGFEDAHLHFAMHGLVLQQVDLTGSQSLDEALDRIRAALPRFPKGDWIRGRGWNHNIWPSGVQPTRQDLDAIIPDRPAAFGSKDGHSVWVNTRALEMAGIDAQTPDCAGGEIKRDASGMPTGILSERAESLVMDHAPQPNDEALLEAVRAATADASRLGVTAIHNCEGPDSFRALQQMAENGELTIRVWHMIPQQNLPAALEMGLRTGYGDELLTIGHMKAFADGALGSCTAEMLNDYADRPGYRGVAATGSDELYAAVRSAALGGISSAVHAIGDGAVRRVLDIYERLQREGIEVSYPHRIEHVQLLTPADIPRLSALGVTASMQPMHATQDISMADLHWGERARWSYAWRSVLESGATLAFGTDCPVEELNPLRGIHAAVTRQRADGTPAGGWYPQERLSLHEALRAYTLGSATACGQDHMRGSLTPGKLADVTVLSTDITQQPAEALLDTRVEMTILGGNVVFE